MKDLTKKEEQVLLAICSLEGRANLTSIREKIKEYTGKYYAVGTIYSPLKRLHVYGYVKSQTVKEDPAVSKKPVSYFRLTDKGYEALARIHLQNEIMWRQVKLKPVKTRSKI